MSSFWLVPVAYAIFCSVILVADIIHALIDDDGDDMEFFFTGAGKHIAAVLPDTSSSGRDVRPLDVTVTSQTTQLVVLLTGVEGVELAEVHVYRLRCSLPPAEVSDHVRSDQIRCAFL